MPDFGELGYTNYRTSVDGGGFVRVWKEQVIQLFPFNPQSSDSYGQAEQTAQELINSLNSKKG